MTAGKTLKKIIRARSRKTGESYTAARRQVLARRGQSVPAAPRAAAPRAASTRATSMTDASVVAKTGHGYAHWFAILDAFGAAAKGHTASARHLREDHGVNGWHSQGITVAYERERGLRAVNQAKTGFQVAVSKMVPVDLDTAIAAFAPRARGRWLSGADPGLRRALVAALAPSGKGIVRGPKRSRVRYKWDGRSVELVLEPRGKGTSVVASNTQLKDAAQVTLRRSQWRQALDALKAHLAG